MTIRESLPRLHQALFEASTSKSVRSRTTGHYYDDADPVQKHTVAIIDWLNDNEAKLHAEMERLAGTKPWESFHASMKFTSWGIAAGIGLICNQIEGRIATMDRAELTILPPREEGDSFSVEIRCSRLVRNLDFQQKADNEKKELVTALVRSLDDVLDVKKLLQPTARFWKSVEKLSPTK